MIRFILVTVELTEALSAAVDTPTDFDISIERAYQLIRAEVLFLYGSIVPKERLEHYLEDFHQLLLDMEAIEHGEISVYNGIEAFLEDLIVYIHDFDDFE